MTTTNPVTDADKKIWIVSQIQTRDMKCSIAHAVAFYFTHEEAVRCLDYLDTEAGWYMYVVIETFSPGYLAMSKSEEWYARNKADDGWIPCEKPDALANVVHFGLG